MTKVVMPVTEVELERDYADVMAEVDRLSLARRGEIWERWPGFVEDAGTWACLRELHIALFGGLLSFAGEVRTRNLSKGGFRFASAMFLPGNIPLIEVMPQGDFDEILEKYVEMNIAHPFREGNGRAMRLWLDAMLEKELNTRVDWRAIRREDYLSAMERSPVNSLELASLLRGALLPPPLLADRLLFLTGLSVSYGYERD